MNAIDIGIRFEDVFVAKNESAERMTFSNMPWPGLVSRPDRMFYAQIGARNEIKNASSIKVIGDGFVYKNDFFYHILWNRFCDAMSGKECLFDCGPNGFCECGVCVTNPNGIVDEREDCKTSCNLCSDDMYAMLYWCLLIGIAHAIVYYGLIHGLYVRPRWKMTKRCSLPICIFFIISFVLFVLVIVWRLHGRMKETIFNLMDEELFPSDHRGLVATFEK